MGENIRYISSYNISDNVLASAEDSTNWNINESIIKSIFIVTLSTDWDLILYCDSDQSSGMFDSIKVAKNLSGDQKMVIDLPYIDNTEDKKVHCLFVDNGASNGAIIKIFGNKAGVE